MLIESSLPRDLNQLAEKGDFEFLVCSKVTIISMLCNRLSMIINSNLTVEFVE